jgi:hypothetical protein
MMSFTRFVRAAIVGCGLSPLAVDFVSAQPTFTDQSALVLGGVNLNARSVSAADIDGDTDLDLFFQGLPGNQKLYRNNLIGAGTFNFTDVTASMLPAGLGDSWSAAWGDYNGDRRIDVFVGQSNDGSAAGDVLRNGGGGFVNASAATGLNDPGWHQNLAWNDIDNDRDLDLIIGMEGPEKHQIYLQGPANQFTPVGASVGLQAPFGTKAYGMAIGDADSDGDLDIYISTCRFGGNIRNNFFKNMLKETGALGFVDIADSNGTQYLDNSYGAEFHDFDDDSDLDLFMVGADGNPSKIWRNDGGNMFTDVDSLTGHALLSATGSDFNGGRAVDYDNDGDLDLFLHDHLAVSTNYARKLFRNDGNWQFTDVTTAEGLHSVNQGGYDSAWADLDRDGDQDLIAATGSGFAERVLVSNVSTNGNHWLYLRLAGPTENTTGIGAAVYATIHQGTPEERTLRREANTNAGTFNQSDLPVHFGLGAATVIDELRIRWPDGTVQWLYDVPANQHLTVRTPGDFDGDGVVDGGDLMQWQDDFALNDQSDMNLDGQTDGADFLAWQRMLGNGAAAATAATSIPEPPSVVLLPSTLVASIARRRRR